MSVEAKGKFAFMVPLGTEVDFEKRRTSLHFLTVTNDSQIGRELIEAVADELGAQEVMIEDSESSSSHYFSSRTWNAPWEPAGPTSPWRPPGEEKLH